MYISTNSTTNYTILYTLRIYTFLSFIGLSSNLILKDLPKSTILSEPD